MPSHDVFRDATKLSGSTPPVGPTRESPSPWMSPEAQNVCSFTVGPSLLKRLRLRFAPAPGPHCQIRVRHDRLAAVFGDDVLPARVISATASSQEMRVNWREPSALTGAGIEHAVDCSGGHGSRSASRTACRGSSGGPCCPDLTSLPSPPRRSWRRSPGIVWTPAEERLACRLLRSCLDPSSTACAAARPGGPVIQVSL